MNNAHSFALSSGTVFEVRSFFFLLNTGNRLVMHFVSKHTKDCVEYENEHRQDTLHATPQVFP